MKKTKKKKKNKKGKFVKYPDIPILSLDDAARRLNEDDELYRKASVFRWKEKD